MNTLSWFLYFADIVPKIAFGLQFAAFAGAVGLLIYVIIIVGHNDQANWDRKTKVKPYPSFYYILIPIFLFFSSLVLPSKNTMYAIAASEFGETIIKSETAGKVHQALNAWLDSQIKELKSK